MRITRSTWLGTSLAAALLFGAAASHAQYRTSVQGTVTDSTGAVIPGATLTLKDNANNQTIVHQSDPSGVFNFNALPADHFTLTVKAPGFSTKVLSNLEFIPEQANSVNVSLDVGGTDVSITVDASTTPAMDTETSNIGATISSNDIQHTPSFNRDVFTLTQLVPGAISDGSQAAGGGVYSAPGNQGISGSTSGGAAPTENKPQATANGQANSNNSISIDGISTVSAVWGGSTIITPTEESIDNVRIVTNDYDAENGRFSGAQTMVTSKSGTDQLHGSAFIAIHRPGLNAMQRSLRYGPNNAAGAASGSVANNPVKDTQRFNQYGGSFGGPIWKDKIFAFFAYESSPNSSNSTGFGWYETPAFRSSAAAAPIAKQYLSFAGAAPQGTLVTGGTSATCAALGLTEGVNCSAIAGQGLDIGSPIKTGVGTQDLTASGKSGGLPGVGGGLDGVADVALYNTVTPYTSYYRQYNGRLDANVTSKDHISYAIYWVPQGSTTFNGGARTYQLFNHSQINEAMSGIWNHTFSPTFLNEARANAAGWRWNEITDNPQSPVGLPQDSISFFGTNSTTVGQFGPSVGSDLNQWTFTYKDVATKIAGRHTIKFGAEETRLHYLQNPAGVPNYAFYNIWDFLNDAPATESGGFNPVTGIPGGSRQDQRENLFGAFVQDDFKVKPNLTLHAGLRYSYFGGLYNKQNNLQHVSLGTGTTAYTSLSIQQGGTAWNPQKLNFGPQLGFNWSPTLLHDKLVVRGGYGLSYNQEEIAITANTSFNPPTEIYPSFSRTSPAVAGANGAKIVYAISSSPTAIYGYPSNPNTITSFNTAGLPTAGSANVVILGDGHGNLPTSYTQHFSLDTQYEANKEIVFSLGYQGSLGRHLINHETPNAPAVVAGDALNPLVTSGDFWQNIGSSNNNAMLVEVKHPMVHHFSADAQFMWAKSMDTDGSGPYSEDPYFPLNAAYSYGVSDYNVGKSFKAFGLWQPVIWHGNHEWLEKVVGGWSLSGIFNWHTGFPYTPTYGLSQSLYCQYCGYSSLRPSYNHQGGSDHSNAAFVNGSNFLGLNAAPNAPTANVNGTPGTVVAYSNKYFNVPNFQNAITWANPAGYPAANQALPSRPGMDRNAFVGPGYKDVDASLSKAFGLPNNRVTGDHAALEIRADAFNLFNIANLNPQKVINAIDSTQFGQINFNDSQAVLGGRTITLQARFSF
jgi:hypothetical protein